MLASTASAALAALTIARREDAERIAARRVHFTDENRTHELVVAIMEECVGGCARDDGVTAEKRKPHIVTGPDLNLIGSLLRRPMEQFNHRDCQASRLRDRDEIAKVP